MTSTVSSSESNRLPSPSVPGTSGVSVFLGAATITAGAALWQQEGRSSLMLPLMAILILITYAAKYRFEKAAIRNICRAALFSVVIVIYRTHPPNTENYFVDPFVLDQCGELCMAEVVIRAWSRYSSARYNPTFIILPIGIVFVVATNNYNDNVGRYFTPVFAMFIALGIQTMRSAASPGARRRAMAGVGVAIASAAFLGALLYQALYINREALTAWANRVLNGTNIPLTATGLADESHLGSVFGRSGSYDRVMRIRTTASASVSYMRAYAMYTYLGGYWGPLMRDVKRKYVPVFETTLQTSDQGASALVNRYINSSGLVFAPLNALSIDIDDANNLRWDQEDGGPLRFDPPGPDSYTMTIGAVQQQGVLCTPPDAEHLQQLLTVPKDIDPRISALSNSITAGITDPLAKARAIEEYLPAHHAYSQRIRVNLRDPLGDFLFNNKAAHCEFFASAAVILMRCAKVPARYVIGYYAHEVEDGDIVVRQRDAHAWAECWIQGKGWFTIDATPPSGRPEGDAESVPTWKHAIERLQDWMSSARKKLTPQNTLRFAGVFVCLALCAYLLQNRYHFNWRRARRAPVREYTSASEALKPVYSRFESVCRRSGLNCPPNKSWQQYLTGELNRLTATSTDGESGSESLNTISAVAEFAVAYDLARFGRGLSPDEYASLSSKLDMLERSAKRIVTEEKSI